MRVSSIPFDLSFTNGNGNEVKVHSLADLSANFNLSDLWKHFKSGDLARWLNNIGEPQLEKKLTLLKGIQDRQIVLPRLCEILGFPKTSGMTSDMPITFDESKNAFRQLELFHARIDHLIKSAEGLCRNESSEKKPSEDKLAKIDQEIRLCNENINVINLELLEYQHQLSSPYSTKSYWQEKTYCSQHALERAQKELEKLQNQRATLSGQIEKYRSYESHACCGCEKSVRLSPSAWQEHRSLQQEVLAFLSELPQGVLLEKVETVDYMCLSCLIKHLNEIRRQIIDYKGNIACDLISVLQAGDILPGKMYSRASGGVTILLENGLHAFCALTELEKDVRASLTQCISEHQIFQFEVIGVHLGEGKDQRGQVTLSRRKFWDVKDKTSTHLGKFPVNQSADRSEFKSDHTSTDNRSRVQKPIKQGDVVKGVVTGFGNNEDGSCYGAFVNIGNEDGLLHVSEMSSSFVKDPKELFHIGDVIDVKVLSVTSTEDGKRRIALSVRQLKSDDSKRPAPQPNKKAVARQPSPRPNQRPLPRQRTYQMCLIDGLSIINSFSQTKAQSLRDLLRALKMFGVRSRLYFPHNIRDILKANGDLDVIQLLDKLAQYAPGQLTVYSEEDDVAKCVRNVLSQEAIGLISNDENAAELSRDVCRVTFSADAISIPLLGLHYTLEELSKSRSEEKQREEKKGCRDRTNVGILEGKTVEFKRSIIFSAKTHEPGEDRISEIVETCAAFMNTEGGELYLGVDDKGFVTGIEGDLAHLEKVSIHGLNGETDEEFSYSATPDGFQRKLINAIKMYISTDAATNLIDGPFFITDEKSGLTYAKLTVKAVEKPEVVYFGSKWYGTPKRVFVRIGASTEFLEGEDLVTFMQKRFGVGSNGQ